MSRYSYKYAGKGTVVGISISVDIPTNIWMNTDRAVISKVVRLRDSVASILGGGPFWVRYSCVSWLRHRVIGEVFNWR